MRSPPRPRRPASPPTEAGYWLEEKDPDATRAAKVLVAARRQGARRDAEARARAEGQQRMASILERARARVEGQRG
jgi:hypothetical protein